MMWVWITHKLLGWHWIEFMFGYDSTIRRVRTAPNGMKYVLCYGSVYYVRWDGTFKNYPRNYTPLTWDLEDERRFSRKLR